MHRVVSALLIVAAILLLSRPATGQVGTTTITKWQHGKTGAVSITFDDGTINHFRVARPLLNERDFPGTFSIVTGGIPGSEEGGKFVGRPVEEIIEETAHDTTDADNFFERASAVRYLGYEGTYEYHMEAGALYEQGNVHEAYDVIDEGYRKVRQGEHEKKDGSWDDPHYEPVAGPERGATPSGAGRSKIGRIVVREGRGANRRAQRGEHDIRNANDAPSGE